MLCYTNATMVVYCIYIYEYNYTKTRKIDLPIFRLYLAKTLSGPLTKLSKVDVRCNHTKLHSHSEAYM